MKKKRCEICNKPLRVFENIGVLCSCKRLLCMQHKDRLLHQCPDMEDVVKEVLDKVVAPKIIKI